MPDLIEEDDMSKNGDLVDHEGENNSNIFKLFMNMESKLYRRLERNEN